MGTKPSNQAWHFEILKETKDKKENVKYEMDQTLSTFSATLDLVANSFWGAVIILRSDSG